MSLKFGFAFLGRTVIQGNILAQKGDFWGVPLFKVTFWHRKGMALDCAIRCGNDSSESVYDGRGILLI